VYEKSHKLRRKTDIWLTVIVDFLFNCVSCCSCASKNIITVYEADVCTETENFQCRLDIVAHLRFYFVLYKFIIIITTNIIVIISHSLVTRRPFFDGLCRYRFLLTYLRCTIACYWRSLRGDNSSTLLWSLEYKLARFCRVLTVFPSFPKRWPKI